MRRPLGADVPHLDALRSRRWRGVALVLAGATSAEPAGVHGAVVAAQQLVRRAPPPTLLLLTAGTQRPVALAAPAPLSAAAHGGACGVARVLALEHPSTRVVAADAGGGATDAAAVRGVARAALALAAGGGDGANFESELAWCGGGAHAARLRRRETVDGARVGGGGRGGGGWASCGGGACVVSGGLGGLGLRAAAEAAAGGARALVLSSRSGRVARGGQGLDEQLRAVRSARGCAVRVIACDVGEAASVRALLGAAASSGHALRAVMHAAGVGAALLVGNMHHGVVDAVVRPKAAAAWHVHRGVAASCVSPLLLFSSVAAAFGNAGQAGYAAANAYLDALARGRRAHGLAARSAQLPLVGGAGMGAAAFGARQQRYRGMAAIALDEYAASVRVLLARPEAGGGLALTVRAVLPGAAAALLDAVPGAAAASKLFADVAVAADAADGASSVARCAEDERVGCVGGAAAAFVARVARRGGGGARGALADGRRRRRRRNAADGGGRRLARGDRACEPAASADGARAVADARLRAPDAARDRHAPQRARGRRRRRRRGGGGG